MTSTIQLKHFKISKTEMESRTQGLRPRPRTQKNPGPRAGMIEAKAKDQGHKCKCFPKKKGLKKLFSVDLQKKKNGLENIFQSIYKISTVQKIVLPLSRGQGNFRGLEASRPRPWT